jgi:hypothetical protein
MTGCPGQQELHLLGDIGITGVGLVAPHSTSDLGTAILEDVVARREECFQSGSRCRGIRECGHGSEVVLAYASYLVRYGDHECQRTGRSTECRKMQMIFGRIDIGLPREYVETRYMEDGFLK